MKHTRILLLIALLGAAAVGLSSLRGGTIVVTDPSDSGPGCLRQALADANDGDLISFDPSLNGQTITLTSGELLVNKNVAISGPGASTLAVDANYTSRVFHIASGKDATISGLTVTHGTAPPPNNAGAGIYNDHATLTVSGCTISGNSTVWGQGGGIYNDGYPGGATLTITNCTISGNSTVPGSGAGIFNWVGTLTITNSALSDNSAGLDGGGGISNFGTTTITNSTLSGNSAGNAGGAILNWSETALTITNSTLSGNSAGGDGGGGIFNEGGTLKIGDTILNAGPSGENINNQLGTVISLGYNLSSDNGGGLLTATGDQINTDPKLGPLQNNGGPTFTHLPASDSPAIDAGDPTLGMDQRGAGFPRMIHGRIDVGAVEARAIAKPPANVQVTVQTNPAGLAFSVDGTPYASTQTFSWTSGSTHTIATTSPQNGAPGVRYVWMNWMGGGTMSHTITPTTNKTYTANFRKQYQLTISYGTGGKVSPASGWKNSGTIFSTTATPSNGYSFSNWTGSGNGSYSGTNNPASITMNEPITEMATFTHN